MRLREVFETFNENIIEVIATLPNEINILAQFNYAPYSNSCPSDKYLQIEYNNYYLYP
jgi:hypothetical protein